MIINCYLLQQNDCMPKLSEEKTCQQCGKTLKGRSDKKFCDDYCRAAHNNDLKSAANNFVRNVNNALGKNRRILESLLTEAKPTASISKDKLMEKGFAFKYHTHLYTTKDGRTYFFCYEYGYWVQENNWCLVVKRDEE